jgi:hypothetical protein
MIVTIEELIEAAETNGYVHSRGHWFADSQGQVLHKYSKDHPIEQACFMGQIALNLGVHHSDLHSKLNHYFDGLGADIIYWNDSKELEYEDILSRFKICIANMGHTKISLKKKVYNYTKRIK